jgi:Xaa-Pro aminopeptidase
MLNEIDNEMEKRGFSSVISWAGSTDESPSLEYLVGGRIARETLYLKKKDEKPILIVAPLDLGSARKSRIKDIRTYEEFGRRQLIDKHGQFKGTILFFEKVLKKLGFEGKIGVVGKTDAARILKLTSELKKKNLHLEGDWRPDLAESLRETKDEEEMEKLAEVASLTEKVVMNTLHDLQHCKVENNKLIHKGKPLTTGKVKAYISQQIAEQGITEPEETIFSVGTEGADPHNAGGSQVPVRTGVPIVFDIFPKHRSGYWNDLTRTYCLGKAPTKLKKYFEDVHEAQTWAGDALVVGKPYRELAEGVCAVLEKRGHPTYRTHIKAGTDAKMNTGFFHGVGHGVGLTIGEPPYYGSTSEDYVQEGQVVTIEPGVYYPGWGGIRIEDTVAIAGRRKVRNFNRLPKELEV